jgi:hypothetical protein
MTCLFNDLLEYVGGGALQNRCRTRSMGFINEVGIRMLFEGTDR